MKDDDIEAIIDASKHFKYHKPSGTTPFNRISKLPESFPNVFQWNHWLGDMISHFTTEGSAHPMHAHIQSLTDVNDYTKGAHHTNGTINEGALRTHVKKTLDIVGRT